MDETAEERQQFRRVSRWLFQSEHYNVHSVGTGQRWKVVYRLAPVEVVGFAGKVDDAMDLADQDFALRQTEYLTEGHGRATLVAEDNERMVEMTDAPVFNTCKCYSVVDNDTDPEGNPIKIHRSCGSTIPKRRTFKPGHDAKYKAALLVAFRAGEDFTFEDGGMLVTKDPLALAKERDWGHFMTEKKVKPAKADKVEDAEVFAGDRGEIDPETLTEDLQGFHPARVKYRNGWRDGMIVEQDDDNVTVRLHLAKGKVKDITLPKDSDKLDLS